MARPKGFNGSAWVDVKFWNGSAWKTYIAPSYSIPAVQYKFDSNNQGWEQSNGGEDYRAADWASGQISGDTPGGILSSVYLAPERGTVPEITVPPGITCKFRYTWSCSKVGSSATDITVYFDAPTLYGGTNQSDTVEFSSQNQGGTYTTKGYVVSPADGKMNPVPAIALNDAFLGSGNKTRLKLSQVELVDNAGNVIQKLSNVPWQPYVWNGSKWI